MINCSPLEVQIYCRSKKLWPNKLVISYFNDVIKLDILLFASYKYKLPFEVINKTFDTKEEVDTYVKEMVSMYPRIEVIQYDYRKGED